MQSFNHGCVDYNNYNTTQENEHSSISQGGASGQQSSEQPPMPPEAQAQLNQLKNMPCPMTQFPQSMKNGNMPNWNSGPANYSPYMNNMFQEGYSSSQNPHMANNSQLHSQNFQLHQQLHGFGGNGSQGDIQNVMSNSQRQHSMNPQLHAQNMKMHQNIHGVGNGNSQNQGQQLEALKNERTNMKKMNNQTKNQQPTSHTGQNNYNPHSQNISNTYSTAAGQHQHLMGYQKSDEVTSNNLVMGHNHSSHSPYSSNNQVAGHTCSHNNITDQTSISHDYPGSHHHFNHNNSYEAMKSQSMPQFPINKHSSHYQMHSNDINNNQHYDEIPQHNVNNTYHSHEHLAANNVSHGRVANATMNAGPVETNRVDMSPVHREHNLEIEPHFSVVQRSYGNHEIVKYKGDQDNYNLGYQEVDCYPSQVNSMSYEILPNAQNVHSLQPRKNDGLQGIRPSPSVSPRNWVIGPPQNKSKSPAWGKPYA